MVKLSIALATYNEEANLGRCLEAIKNIADEIVVVDGSSEDKTVEIAKSHQAKVIVTDNPPIFHINKQKAIDACEGQWILQLDADEVIPENLKKEIIERINADSPENGYWIKRKNYFLGRFLSRGGQYPDPVIRLIRKGKAHLPCQSVHEQIKVEGPVGWLNEPMLHYSVPNFSRYLTNSNRYTSLTAQELKQQQTPLNIINWINYCLWKPFLTFVSLYGRHRGYADGFPGFVFALFSGLHHTAAFIKYWQMSLKVNQATK